MVGFSLSCQSSKIPIRTVCAIEYSYDTKEKEWINIYTDIKLKGDTIYWVLEGKSDSGTYRKHFANEAILKNNEADVILESGVVYKFKVIADGKCGTDEQMDKFMKENDNDN